MGVTRLRELHHDAFVFDGHNDLALRLLAGEDPSGRLQGGHLDLPRMREGGFDGGIFAVWSDPDAHRPLADVLDGVARLRVFLEETPGMRLVLTADDLEAAAAASGGHVSAAGASGDVAALIGVEGAYGVEEPSDVDRLYDAGARCLTLTWMAHTPWADASGLPPAHGGLTDAGRRILARAERLGMIADISHSSDATARDVLGAAQRPVIASHSGVRAVADHHRNLPDDLLEELAARGGVLGVNFFSAYLDEGFSRGYEAVRARLEREGADDVFQPRSALGRAVAAELKPVPFSRLLEHFRRAIAVAGPEHVGLGSDFDGVLATPEGLDDVRDLPKITAGLAEDGLTDEDLRSVLGGNFRRVLSDVLP
ncbi:MAG: membrane dipeptidase [Gemmatimonadetes bacterium]|nr:membrane dipeptidase [Gemmatimonadota bacterium]